MRTSELCLTESECVAAWTLRWLATSLLKAREPMCIHAKPTHYCYPWLQPLLLKRWVQNREKKEIKRESDGAKICVLLMSIMWCKWATVAVGNWIWLMRKWNQSAPNSVEEKEERSENNDHWLTDTERGRKSPEMRDWKLKKYRRQRPVWEAPCKNLLYTAPSKLHI